METSPRKKKKNNNRAYLDQLEDAKLKHIEKHNRLKALYRNEVGQDLRCVGPEMDKMIGTMKSIHGIVEHFQSDFVSQQCFATYENYDRAIGRLFCYFRSSEGRIPSFVLQKLVELEKTLGQELDIIITKLEDNCKKN